MGYHNCSLHDIGSLDSRIHYVPDRPAVLMVSLVTELCLPGSPLSS